MTTLNENTVVNMPSPMARSGMMPMSGTQWFVDNGTDDPEVVEGASGDIIPDFDLDCDVIDLSPYGLRFEQLTALMVDRGWATEIDLSQCARGYDGDRVYLKSIAAEELDASNFIL